MEMNESNMGDSRWNTIRNGKRVLDVFRAKKLPVIQIKECHRADEVNYLILFCNIRFVGV